MEEVNHLALWKGENEETKSWMSREREEFAKDVEWKEEISDWGPAPLYPKPNPPPRDFVGWNFRKAPLNGPKKMGLILNETRPWGWGLTDSSIIN